MEKITSCPKCHGNRFFVTEIGTWDAYFDDDGSFVASKPDTEVSEVTCAECDAEIYGILLDNGQEINFD